MDVKAMMEAVIAVSQAAMTVAMVLTSTINPLHRFCRHIGRSDLDRPIRVEKHQKSKHQKSIDMARFFTTSMGWTKKSSRQMYPDLE